MLADVFDLARHGNSGVIFNNVGAILRHLIPIHDIPPVRNVLRPAVLILEVVTEVPSPERI